MDKIWRLLVATFCLVLAAILIMLAYLFENTWLAVVGIYGAFAMILFGIGKGLFAIIDYNNEKKTDENE